MVLIKTREIEMKKDFRVLLIFANSTMDNLIPLGTSLLAGALRDKGIEYKIFDTTFYKTVDVYPDETRVKNLQLKSFDYSGLGVEIRSYDDLINDFVKAVDDYKPSLIALSAVETTYFQGLRLLCAVKDKKIPVVVGGVTAIFSPADLIKEGCIDMVCIGEGEAAFPELCYRMIKGESYSDIPGFWIKENNRVLKNSYRPLVDINTIPFLDFSGFQPERFVRPMYGRNYRMIPFELTRGCPYRCTYCADPSLSEKFKGTGKWYREKSVERIRKEIEFYIKNYSVDFLYFVSDSFLAIENKKLDKILSLLEEFKIPFWANTRLETITEERMKRLEKTQCVRLSIGIEHGSETFRKKVLDRQYSNEMCVKKFDIMGSLTIPVTINNIIGIPGDTRELVFDTIRLNKQCLRKPDDTASLFIFAPYRGTKLRELCVKKGYIPEDYWVKFDLNIERDFEISGLTNEQISGLMRTFGPYCKFPESDWPLIEKAEKFDAEGNRAFDEISRIYWDAKRGEPITAKVM